MEVFQKIDGLNGNPNQNGGFGGTPILGNLQDVQVTKHNCIAWKTRIIAKDCQRLCSYELKARGQTLRFRHLHMELPLVFQFLHRGRHLKRSQREPRLVRMEVVQLEMSRVLSKLLHIPTPCICTASALSKAGLFPTTRRPTQCALPRKNATNEFPRVQMGKRSGFCLYLNKTGPTHNHNQSHVLASIKVAAKIESTCNPSQSLATFSNNEQSRLRFVFSSDWRKMWGQRPGHNGIYVGDKLAEQLGGGKKWRNMMEYIGNILENILEISCFFYILKHTYEFVENMIVMRIVSFD